MSRIIVAIAIASGLATADAEEPRFVPKEGFVPDAKTAIRIAEAVWAPIYGTESIERQRPLNATFSNGVWTVTGTLAPARKGGVALAEISKADGRILRVSHGK